MIRLWMPVKADLSDIRGREEQTDKNFEQLREETSHELKKQGYDHYAAAVEKALEKALGEEDIQGRLEFLCRQSRIMRRQDGNGEVQS